MDVPTGVAVTDLFTILDIRYCVEVFWVFLKDDSMCLHNGRRDECEKMLEIGIFCIDDIP